MNETQSISWTAGNGAEIVVNVAADYLLNSQGVRNESGEKKVVLNATINGKRENCVMGLQAVTGHPVAVAKLGNIGINADNLAKIKAAIAQVNLVIADHNDAIYSHADKLDKLGNGCISQFANA